MRDAVVAAIARVPTTYRLTNCTAPDAPSEAAPGDTVIVPLVFSEGFGIVNPTDAYVTNDGDSVASTWNANDNTLTFTMPEEPGEVIVTVNAVSVTPTPSIKPCSCKMLAVAALALAKKTSEIQLVTEAEYTAMMQAGTLDGNTLYVSEAAQ